MQFLHINSPEIFLTVTRQKCAGKNCADKSSRKRDTTESSRTIVRSKISRRKWQLFSISI